MEGEAESPMEGEEKTDGRTEGRTDGGQTVADTHTHRASLLIYKTYNPVPEAPEDRLLNGCGRHTHRASLLTGRILLSPLFPSFALSL